MTQKTTLESLTNEQIMSLRAEALQHGDVAMAVICEIASAYPETIAGAQYDSIAPDVRAELEAMSNDDARARVVAAINNAEAQS